MNHPALWIAAPSGEPERWPRTSPNDTRRTRESRLPRLRPCPSMAADEHDAKLRDTVHRWKERFNNGDTGMKMKHFDFVHPRLFVLALPCILLPSHETVSLSGHRFDLGLPPMANIKLGTGDFFTLGRLWANVGENLIGVLCLAIFWSVVIYTASRIRQWAKGHGGLLGALIHSALISAYFFLWFFFSLGAFDLISYCIMNPMDWGGLLASTRTQRILYPFMWIIATTVLIIVLWKDARLWPSRMRKAHIGTVIVSLGVLVGIAKLFLPLEMADYSEMIAIIQKEIAKTSVTTTNPSPPTR